jgi:hypothetical protein
MREHRRDPGTRQRGVVDHPHPIDEVPSVSSISPLSPEELLPSEEIRFIRALGSREGNLAEIPAIGRADPIHMMLASTITARSPTGRRREVRR